MNYLDMLEYSASPANSHCRYCQSLQAFLNSINRQPVIKTEEALWIPLLFQLQEARQLLLAVLCLKTFIAVCITHIDPRLIEAASLGEFRDPLLRKVYHRIIVDRKVENAKKAAQRNMSVS